MQRLAGSTGLFVLCVAAIAQTDRGTITGTISGPAGAVIAEASVEARNMATGAAYHVATIGTGNYTLSQLPAGNCEISITVPGFKRYVRQGPWLANPNNVYPGFPATQQLFQALRSYPQWTGVPLFLEPPLGVTWYDSLQAKVTKRLSRGLMVDSAFTWQKQLNLGVGAGTAYLTPAPNLINDVFNRQQLKQISGFSRPFQLVLSFRYTTPGFAADSRARKALSWAAPYWKSRRNVSLPERTNDSHAALQQWVVPPVGSHR